MISFRLTLCIVRRSPEIDVRPSGSPFAGPPRGAARLMDATSNASCPSGTGWADNTETTSTQQITAFSNASFLMILFQALTLWDSVQYLFPSQRQLVPKKHFQSLKCAVLPIAGTMGIDDSIPDVSRCAVPLEAE